MADDPTTQGWTVQQLAEPPRDVPAPSPAPDAPEGEETSDIPFRPLGVTETLDAAIAMIRRSPRATLGMALILTSVLAIIITLASYWVLGPAAAGAGFSAKTLGKVIGTEAVTSGLGLVLRAYLILLLSGLLAPVAAWMAMGRSTSLRSTWAAVRPRFGGAEHSARFGGAEHSARFGGAEHSAQLDGAEHSARFGRLLGSASLVMLMVVLAGGLPVVPFIVALVDNASAAIGLLSGLLGIAAGLCLMVLVYVWFALAPTITVLENRGVLDGLGRARRIVSGGWWRTFGTLCAALLVTVFVGVVAIPLPFTLLENLVLTGHATAGWAIGTALTISMVGGILAGTLTNPFNAGVIALLYTDRRMRREGFDIQVGLDEPSLGLWLPSALTEAANRPQPVTPGPPTRTFMMPPPMYPGPYSPGRPPPPGAGGQHGTWRPPAGQGGRVS